MRSQTWKRNVGLNYQSRGLNFRETLRKHILFDIAAVSDHIRMLGHKKIQKAAQKAAEKKKYIYYAEFWLITNSVTSVMSW